MKLLRQGVSPPVLLLFAFMASFGLSGCDGDDGAAGAAGAAGQDGADGADGFSCWDLNQNGVGDLPDEDINDDGVVDVLDCNATSSNAYAAEQLHKGYFEEHAYEGTQSCLDCHGKIGDDLLTTAHFTWAGESANIEGFAGGIHGKKDIINNFCIAIPSNEGRCTQCHAGYGYADATFDFTNPDNVDCLVCHDQTGLYAKAPTTAGLPPAEVGNPPVPLDLTLVAQSVAENGGVPTIDNCIFCHANAGGGDNVKHGDLSMSLADTTRDFDVHMGTDGADYECVACHQVNKDGEGNVLSHGIGGMPYHSVDEGVMKQCDDCHGDRFNIHVGTTVQNIVNSHDTLACQVCHIPTFARNTSTKVEWYWKDAGQDIAPIPVDPATGRATYDKKKGTFVWANNVRPTLRYFNGKYTKFLIGDNDQYTSLPAILAEPVGYYTDSDAMIYPFKKMIGNQPADAGVGNTTMLVPHLFGTAGGPNPYWGKYDWNLALEEGAAAAGQTYSGAYEFVPTEMYLSVNHEVAPKEMAYGKDGHCDDCHFGTQVDWGALGWSGDPALGNNRP